MKNVLVIEDSIDDINFIKKGYSKFKDIVDLHIAEDFEQAQNKIKEADFCLIILDINLPRKNGLHILKDLKSDTKTRHIPITIFSTSKFKDDIIEAYENGCNCYFEKPFDYKEFIKTIENILEFWMKNTTISVTNSE